MGGGYAHVAARKGGASFSSRITQPTYLHVRSGSSSTELSCSFELPAATSAALQAAANGAIATAAASVPPFPCRWKRGFLLFDIELENSVSIYYILLKPKG